MLVVGELALGMGLSIFYHVALAKAGAHSASAHCLPSLFSLAKHAETLLPGAMDPRLRGGDVV